MKKSNLIAKIKTYEGNAERQKKRADQFYAKYKQTNDTDDYMQSQYYYRESEDSLNTANVYKDMLANGEYE